MPSERDIPEESNDGDESTMNLKDQPLPVPDYPCPFCGETLWPDDEDKHCWLGGLPDATTVPGEGDYRAVHHCSICETAVVRNV